MIAFRSALVSGATGFIGSALVARLLEHGVHVTCLLRQKKRALSIPHLSSIRVIEVPSFQTSTMKALLANVSAEVIFNLASYGVSQDADDLDADEFMEGNVSLVIHLLESVADWPLRRFIHVGSCSEYGFPLNPGTPIAETHPLRPSSLYGAAKAASVLFGNVYARRLQVPFVTARLFGVFGPREAPQRLIPYLINCLRHDKAVDLTPGEQVRDFLFEDDVADALIEAASARLTSYEVYNVCSSRPTRIREIGEAVASALQKPSKLLHWGERQYRPYEPMWLVGDNSRFITATSWRPVVTVEAGIQRMILLAKSLPEDREHQHAV